VPIEREEAKGTPPLRLAANRGHLPERRPDGYPLRMTAPGGRPLRPVTPMDNRSNPGS
jgi:hypothetical protein